MQVIPPEEELNSFPPSPGNLSHEGTVHSQPKLETMSSHLDHLIEGEVELIEEGSLSSNNTPLIKPISPTIVELPFARYIDLVSHYRLPPWSKYHVSSTPITRVMLGFHS